MDINVAARGKKKKRNVCAGKQKFETKSKWSPCVRWTGFASTQISREPDRTKLHRKPFRKNKTNKKTATITGLFLFDIVEDDENTKRLSYERCPRAQAFQATTLEIKSFFSLSFS